PILDVGYRDSAGVRYQEQSFVDRMRHKQSLVSFIRVAADGSHARTDAVIRLQSSAGRTIRLIVRRGHRIALYAAFIHQAARLVRIYDEYQAAHDAVGAFWRQRLAGGAQFDVPEPAVEKAVRAVEIQDLEMSWRYSVGNTYEELSYVEALDVAQVMAAYGFPDVARQILEYTLRRLPEHFTAWRAGEQLVATSAYIRLARDPWYVMQNAKALAALVDPLPRSLGRNRTGLLEREPYSSDIARPVYSLQGQSVAWHGLRAISQVWAEAGFTQQATRARLLARRLERGLRRAVRVSA